MIAPPASDRYFGLIEATLCDALTNRAALPRVEDSADFPIELVLPAVVRDVRESSATDRSRIAARFLSASHVIDRAGHARPVYAALAVRWLGREDPQLIDRFATQHAAAIAALADGTSPITAANGGAVVAATFAAWVTAGAKDAAVIRTAIAALHRVAATQQPDGTFLARTDADAPEPRWYDELAILHALNCHATATNDASITAAVRRAVDYHAAETQPDHASSHPWAIAAFLATPEAIPLADMMLHAAGVQSPRTMDAVSLLLLADALDCGRPRLTR